MHKNFKIRSTLKIQCSIQKWPKGWVWNDGPLTHGINVLVNFSIRKLGGKFFIIIYNGARICVIVAQKEEEEKEEDENRCYFN